MSKKLSKSQAHPEAELLQFENYSLSSFTLSSKKIGVVSKNVQKTSMSVLMRSIILILMKMMLKIQNRCHRYEHKQTLIKCSFHRK